jgi:hypothetical protein
VRLAPKILVDGATWLARSQTYQFAVFGRKISGASAGINALADGRADAIAAFTTELLPDVNDGRLALEAGRGLVLEDLAALHALDARPDGWWAGRVELRVAGIAAAASVAAGGSLDGRTAAVEGFDANGPTLARALAARGASVIAVSTTSGSAVLPRGIDPEVLESAWAAHGPEMVHQLGGASGESGAVFAVAADVLLVGSKVGVLDHEAADDLAAAAVVPSGPVPVTAKALATLRRAGVPVLPDFVTTAGHLAAWPTDGASPGGDLPGAAVALVEGALAEVMDHPSGPVLAACERAEAFLATWCAELPFGRPIA